MKARAAVGLLGVIALILPGGCSVIATPLWTPEPGAITPHRAWVNSSTLPVWSRTGAFSGGEVIGQLECGDLIIVEQADTKWRRIVWSDVEHYVPMEAWVQSDHLKNSKPLDCDTAAPASPAPCNIKGVFGEHPLTFEVGKVYHTPTGPASSCYACTAVDRVGGERWFCSEAEALNAGWVPSQAAPGCCD